MGPRRTWREKLQTGREPKIVRMLIPGSADLEELLRSIPKGKLITDGQIKEWLKKKYAVDAVCAKVLGIRLRIIAEAAEEEIAEGKSEEEVIPYWRVVKKDGGLYPNFPGGVEKQAFRLEKEGHVILRGRKIRVKDFERHLVDI